MRRKLLSLAGVLAVLAPSAWAAERVTLRNGFELRCDHRSQIEGRVRLYLSASEDNYIEFPSQDLATVEQVTDSPPPPVSAQTPSPVASHDAKLNQADLGEILARAGHEHNLDVDLLASVVKAGTVAGRSSRSSEVAAGGGAACAAALGAADPNCTAGLVVA